VQARSLQYRETARRILAESPAMRESVTAATTGFVAQREEAFAELDARALRQWAAGVKSHALTHLDVYLDEAETRLRDRGVQIHWAETAADVHRVFEDVVRTHGVRRAVKAKSMLSEEVGLNPALEALGVEVFETDLGEYILQLLDEPPSHIVGPSIHRSLEETRVLFHERLGTPRDASPEALAAAARVVLREAFLTADLGVSGANFLMAETGSIALIENEGNIRLSTSLPRVHIALVGIEKVLPRWSDLATFLQITSKSATGQPVGTFVSILQGPSNGEPEGPEEMHVVFVDNGRTRLLADPVAWEALRCVRCGACLNVCPVYRQTGGHAYGYVYSGPIGAVIAPGLLGLEETYPLPFASSLCGACADACPVGIPIPQLLHVWRERAVERGLATGGTGLSGRAEGAVLGGWAAASTRPRLFEVLANVAGRLPTAVTRRLPMLSEWDVGRELPEASGSTFRERWRRELEREGTP